MQQLMRFLLVFSIAVVLPLLLLRSGSQDWRVLQTWVSVGGAALAMLGSYFSVRNLSKFPGERSWMSIQPLIWLWYGAVALTIMLLSLPHWIGYLAVSFLLCIFAIQFDYWYFDKHKRIVLAYAPFGRAETAYMVPGADWIRIDAPVLPDESVDGVVTDLHAPDMSTEWQKFLAHCTLEHIPVYNLRQVEESLTGRVRIRHMYENDLGSLLPSSSYMVIKYVLEVLLIFLSLPITVPTMLITALLIKIGDGGSIFYSQTRVGYRGRPFEMYKFRSMTESKQLNQHQTTSTNDIRVTPVGKVIRKLRIDELPQFWNVICGHMALIGPRAEFKKFADELEHHVPFYQYRHVVKPGITGWAQVTHGYATGVDETQIKIEHDFYYIKNFSFGLDALIVMKTIYTMVTGFGAR